MRNSRSVGPQNPGLVPAGVSQKELYFICNQDKEEAENPSETESDAPEL